MCSSYACANHTAQLQHVFVRGEPPRQVASVPLSLSSRLGLPAAHMAGGELDTALDLARLATTEVRAGAKKHAPAWLKQLLCTKHSTVTMPFIYKYDVYYF